MTKEDEVQVWYRQVRMVPGTSTGSFGFWRGEGWVIRVPLIYTHKKKYVLMSPSSYHHHVRLLVS